MNFSIYHFCYGDDYQLASNVAFKVMQVSPVMTVDGVLTNVQER